MNSSRPSVVDVGGGVAQCGADPEAYEKVVIPKYRLVNVKLDKPRVKALIFRAIACLFLAIIFFSIDDGGGSVFSGLFFMFIAIFLLVSPISNPHPPLPLYMLPSWIIRLCAW